MLQLVFPILLFIIEFNNFVFCQEVLDKKTFTQDIRCNKLYKNRLNAVRERLKLIPQEDLNKLDRFFRNLVLFNHFGYTLFGDKPISLKGYFLKVPVGNVLMGQNPVDETIDLLQVWKKYSSWFPSERFLLFDEPQNNQQMRKIVLINKNYFIEKVDQNISYFQSVLGKNITSQQLLKQLEKSDVRLTEILQNHEGLLGILLGYGKQNSIYYQRRNEILQEQCLDKVPIDLGPSLGFLQEELDFLWKHLKICGNNDSPIVMIRSVQFAGDPYAPETGLLNEKYRQTQKKISAIYAKGNFLELTLAQFME